MPKNCSSARYLPKLMIHKPVFVFSTDAEHYSVYTEATLFLLQSHRSVFFSFLFADNKSENMKNVS